MGMIGSKSTFFAVLLIGALVVYLYTTGALNNTSNLTAILLFGVFALAFALEFDLFDIENRPMPEIKVVEKQTTI